MKKLIIFFALMAFGTMAWSQVRNPYEVAANNEDEVIHLEQWQQHATVPLQAIVKLQDYSNFTITDKTSNSNTSKSSNTRVECPAIQAVLDSFLVESVEQLCPTFVMPKEPRRSASYGGGEVTDHDLSQLYLITISPESPHNEYELMERLSALDEVEFAEPNYLCFALGGIENRELRLENEADATYTSIPSIPGVSSKSRASSKSGAVAPPNDPMYSLQWGLGACGIDSLLTAPKRDTSWRPIIAIIDTGVDVDHADLSDNIWTNTAEQNGAANQDDDGNGFRDDVHGWDFVNQTGEIHDFNSHGTHCAGIAGAVTNNGIGIAGACPDAWIMPVAVMQSDGTGDIATIIQGINYARQNGADVINMSIGTYAYSIAMEQALAVAYQTAVLVAAAGNDGNNIYPSEIKPHGPMFPGAFTFVLGIQATLQDNNIALFSNYDSDGPSFSQYNENQLYNYELSAPGVGIFSTVPNGVYRSYNGTSMATPLVAGGIASLMQRREYLTKEILFGDLINYSQEYGPVNFWTAYTADSIAPAILECVAIEINDTANGDSSMTADAGERLQLYPTIRTVWGPADSVEVWLEFQEFEDTNTINILQNHVQLGHPISSYAKSKMSNPIDIYIPNNVVDGRRLSLVLCAVTPNAVDTMRHNFTMIVSNGVRLSGLRPGNDTLWPNVHYIVTSNYAKQSGDTIFIMPGTTIKIADDCSIGGTIIAIGKPDSMISFTKSDLGISWLGITTSSQSFFEYCIFEWFSGRFIANGFGSGITINNSVIREHTRGQGSILFNVHCSYSNILNNHLYNMYGNSPIFWSGTISYYNNIIGNYPEGTTEAAIAWNYQYGASNGDGLYEQSYRNGTYYYTSIYKGNNIFNNNGKNIYCGNNNVMILTPESHYYGSNKEDIIRNGIYDFNTPGSTTFASLDLSIRSYRPSPLAHGIVWKVEVNGYDAQDEFDSIIPLGVGTHEFKVYFNRAMDTSITPIVAMGVRPPYTQTAISENASWSEDSTVYTAHLTLTGRMPIDGLNRIYVSGAQDDEHFEIPYENQRFNVYVASSGSMSTGFQATPGIGKVDLEWNDQEVNYEDFLGFNIYRYQYDSVPRAYYDENWNWIEDTMWIPVDTIRINTSLVQDTVFTDFNVVPGERYYYYYKILSTSLTENSPSKTVSCVPHSTIPGDANGSYAVDVADVITTINYVTGQNPQPFLFDAADVNGDGVINVLDIVNIINIILHPNQQNRGITDQQTAIYTIENDTLYINTPVALAGLQFTIGCTRSDVEVLEALHGFECATVEEDGNLTMVFYSMSGMTVPAGKTPLLIILNSQFSILNLALSDEHGNNVVPMNGNALGLVDLDAVQAQFVTAAPNPFNGKTRIDITVGNYRTVKVVFTDMMGKLVDSREIVTPTAGKYSMAWDASRLPQGIYFATLYADGQKAQTIKLVVK